MTSATHDGEAGPGPVVVGYDGSDGARRALAWAAAEAERRSAVLQVTVCTDWHPVSSPEAAGVLLAAPDLEVVGRELADDAVARLGADHPGLRVRTEVRAWAPPVPSLLAESERAQLVVLGSRGRGAFADLLLGSTSAQVAVHAHCPVVVVRPPWPASSAAGAAGAAQRGSTGGVVVGVDGSPAARAALAFAVATAAQRGAALRAVRVWQVPSLWGSGQHPAPGAHVGDLERAEQALLDADVTAALDAAGSRPALDVSAVVVQGHPVDGLLQASRGADLLVVGSRGSGGFRGLLLGSVSRAVLHHARCPVAMVHSQSAQER